MATVNELIENTRMHYRSETDEHCCICAGKTLCAHSPGSSTLLCEMNDDVMVAILKL